jgi:hypothetical protein
MGMVGGDKRDRFAGLVTMRLDQIQNLKITVASLFKGIYYPRS